ncbi:hypothetical protein [Streptomyces sp. LN785]|uniref:beta family protein n=1 Tax=Streptomyces sp. LN785 TaxID=3112983 RepID=UPI003721E189
MALAWGAACDQAEKGRTAVRLSLADDQVRRDREAAEAERDRWLRELGHEADQRRTEVGARADAASETPRTPVVHSHQAASLARARASGDGLGIRVVIPGEWDGATALGVGDLLARADRAVETDLLPDPGSVPADRDEAAKEALRALDALMPLTPWRTATVLSRVFPAVTAGMLEHGLRAEPRMDRRTWCELSDSGRSYVRRLSHGDYGIQSVRALAREASSGRGGPPWGTLR